jgi:hypothetical protein
MYTVRNFMGVSWMSGGKKRDGVAFQGWCWKEDGSPCEPGGIAARPPWGISQPQSAFELQRREHLVDESNPFDKFLTFPPESLFVVLEGIPGDPESEKPASKHWWACPYSTATSAVVEALRVGRGRVQLLDPSIQQLDPSDQPLDSPVQPSDTEGVAFGLWASSYWTEGGQQLESGGPAIELKQVNNDKEEEQVSQQVIRTWKADSAIRSYLLSNSQGYKLEIGKSSPFYYPNPKAKKEEDEDNGDFGDGEEQVAPPAAPVPPAAAERKGIRPSPQMPSTQQPKAAVATSKAAPPPPLMAPNPTPAPKPYDPHEDPALRLEFSRAQHVGMEVGEDILQAFAAKEFNEGVAADFDRWLKYRNSPPAPGDPLADREKRLAFVRKKEARFAKFEDAERQWGWWADKYYQWDDAKMAEFYEFVKNEEPKGPDVAPRQ